MASSPEPANNPNPRWMQNPPAWLRTRISRTLNRFSDPDLLQARRQKYEHKRQAQKQRHQVEYFHQFADPYCHLTAQILKKLVQNYDIELRCHVITSFGGKNQPFAEDLIRYSRADAERVAPFYGLNFPTEAPIKPQQHLQKVAAEALCNLHGSAFTEHIQEVSQALWTGDSATLKGLSLQNPNRKQVDQSLAAGNQAIRKMGHYSGGSFFYAGEWYWGVDRLFHLEDRLRSLDAERQPSTDPTGQTGQTRHIISRPPIEIGPLDAATVQEMELHFFPSLNSPYTAIIYDKTIALKQACGIPFYHKPVLPMIMRGVPITSAKGRYIFSDAKREANFLGVPFGPSMTPIGEPVRRAYSLMTWARSQGKDEAFMSALLRLAFSQHTGLHTETGMRLAVEQAGLDWHQARQRLGNDSWQLPTLAYQTEMADQMNLWGVPSFRLKGPAGWPDLSVWGQDRLWLIAAEISKRAGARTQQPAAQSAATSASIS
ncbi:MAG: DsbA family protein [Gammaproteobacteria bacterium]